MFSKINTNSTCLTIMTIICSNQSEVVLTVCNNIGKKNVIKRVKSLVSYKDSYRDTGTFTPTIVGILNFFNF